MSRPKAEVVMQDAHAPCLLLPSADRIPVPQGGVEMTGAASDRATNSHISGHTAIAGRQPPISRENHMVLHRPRVMEAHSDGVNQSAYKPIWEEVKWAK